MARKITDEQLNVEMNINGGDKAQKALGDLQQSYRKLKQEEEDLRKAKQNLIADGQKESEAYKQVEQDLKQLKVQMTENKDEQKAYREEIGLAALSVNELTKRQRGLRSQMNAVTPHSEDWERWNKELKETTKRLNEVRDDMRETEDAMGDVGDVTDQLTGAFSDVFQGLRGGNLQQANAGLMVLRGNLKALTAQAWAFITTPLGAALAAVGVVVAAWKVFDDYNADVREATILTERLTGLQGEQADRARVHAKAMEETFGADFKENLKAAKALVNEFEITYEEALDTIEEGLIKGGAANDEYFDSLREYSTFFAQAGYSAQEFRDIINTGYDLGIYSDKLPDAIKEFGLSVKEQTASTRDAFKNAFGSEFTDELFEGINNGSITVKDALQLTAQESERMSITVQENAQLTADAFRGAGEDAGGALAIFEAVNQAYAEQNRALTPLEEQVKKVAEANRELEQAQNDALKSDKYTAFVNDLKVTWIKAKADFFIFINGITEGLVQADTAFRRFVFQTVQYTKDAFTIGADADWEALGKKFDEEQKRREKAAAEQKKKEKEQQEKENISPEEKAALEAEKQAQEAARLAREKAREQAIADEKKRQQELANLEEQYRIERENRHADSLVKQAELEKQRALQKAAAKGAEQELLDQIAAEHDVKIEEARAVEEEQELEKMRAFETRKRELENQFALERAATDEEREILKAEQDLEKEQEKLERDLEQMKITQEQKDELAQLLVQQHEMKIADIRQNYREKELEESRKFNEALIKSEEKLYTAKQNFHRSALQSLMGFFDQSSGIYKALFVLEKALAVNEIIVGASKAIAAAQANHAAVPPVIPGTILPNPMYAVSFATMTKNIAAVKLGAAAEIAAIGAATIKGVTGHEDGLYPEYLDVTRTDGKRFRAKNSGRAGTRIVSEPSYFTDNGGYLAAENGTEMIIDNAVFRRLDPQVIDHIMDVRHNVKGYADGMYPATSTTSQVVQQSDPELKAMLATLMMRLENPVAPKMIYGYEDEEKRQNLQNEIENSKQNGNLTS